MLRLCVPPPATYLAGRYYGDDWFNIIIILDNFPPPLWNIWLWVDLMRFVRLPFLCCCFELRKKYYGLPCLTEAYHMLISYRRTKPLTSRAPLPLGWYTSAYSMTFSRTTQRTSATRSCGNTLRTQIESIYYYFNYCAFCVRHAFVAV